jgi:hypothetical protein
VTTDNVVGQAPTVAAVHLDDVTAEQMDELKTWYIYIWEDEVDERRDELKETVKKFRSEYIYTIGIVYDEVLREVVPLSSSELTAYAWELQLGRWESPETADEARVELQKMLEKL